MKIVLSLYSSLVSSFMIFENQKYLTLREASRIFGYNFDYLNFLVRQGKIKGKKVYTDLFWKTTRRAIEEYCKKRKRKIKNLYFQNRYISLKQAAAISGYTPDYIGYLIRKGKIEGVKTPGQSYWLISRKEIEKYRKSTKSQRVSIKKRTKKQFVFTLPKINNINIRSASYRLAFVVSIFLVLYLSSAISPLWILQDLFKPTLAQEVKVVHLYPGNYESDPLPENGGWQNPVAVFSQDLGEFATFQEFNIENSASPIIFEKIEKEIDISEESEEILSSEQEQPEEGFFFSSSSQEEIISLASSTSMASTSAVASSTNELPDASTTTSISSSSDILATTTEDTESTKEDGEDFTSTSTEISETFSQETTSTWSQDSTSTEINESSSTDINIYSSENEEESTISEEESTTSEESDIILEEGNPPESEMNISSTTASTTTTFINISSVFSYLRRFRDLVEEKMSNFFAPIVRAKEDFIKNIYGGDSTTTLDQDISINHEKKSILILSDFSIPEEFKNVHFNNVQLRMSLAGKGESGDRLVIDYFYKNSWFTLEEFNLESEISNALNSGYFLYGLPVFENIEDLTSFKIRFTYLTQRAESSQSLVFLDAVWLEVDYEEEKIAENLKPEEGIIEIPKEAFKEEEVVQEVSLARFYPEDFLPEQGLEEGQVIRIVPRFNFEIPEDGRIIAEVTNPNLETGGIFRIHFYSKELGLVSTLNVGSGESFEQGYKVPRPQFPDLSYACLSLYKEKSVVELDVKKEWGEIWIDIKYIPFSGKGKFDFDVLELKFKPKPVLLDNLIFLGEVSFGPSEKGEKEFTFENYSTGKIIVDTVQNGKGGGGHFFYLDGKGIGLVESGYIKTRTVFSNILPSEHTLIVKHGDCNWEDNQGERVVNVYFGEIQK